MQEFKSADDILDFAIKNEEDAYALYTSLADKMPRSEMKAVFEQFAQEELGHKAKLLNIKTGGTLKPAENKVLDLKIADYVAELTPHDNMNYQEALVVAMQAEKHAYMLYNDLAGKIDDVALKDLFLALAQEEAKHKLRFEVEYDEHILTEN